MLLICSSLAVVAALYVFCSVTVSQYRLSSAQGKHFFVAYTQ